jgi:hypothetical protein
VIVSLRSARIGPDADRAPAGVTNGWPSEGRRPVPQFVYPRGQSTGIISASFNQRAGDLFLISGAQSLEDDAHTQGRRDLGERAEGRIDMAG